MLIRQCSRKSYFADAFWILDPELVPILEARLRTYITSHPSHDPYFSPLPLSKYHRQYIGFTAHDLRYIYGNFYPANDFPGFPNPDDLPVNVCDGGERYWGILFSAVSLNVLSVDVSGALRAPPTSTAIPPPPLTIIRPREAPAAGSRPRPARAP